MATRRFVSLLMVSVMLSSIVRPAKQMEGLRIITGIM